jgi:mannose-6-phosphate isomerase-like protein (cupin superfamily)
LEVEQMATFERNPASLSRRELRDFAQHLADEPERWAHLLDAEDEETRVYELIWDDGRVNAWVIRWSEDADTGYHDHDESAAAITVISGDVREDRLAISGLPRTRLLGAGETFTVEPSAIHRVLHAGCGPALTIHAYSPPLRRTGAYSVGDGGELRRESQPFDVELTAEPALV